MNNYFEQLNQEEKQADIDYAKIIIEDKDKTYLDLLPKEFSKSKRGIIIKDILEHVDEAHKVLNDSGLFDRVITKEDIVRFMMRGVKYSNFFLAYKFIPRVNDMDIWMRFWDELRKREVQPSEKEKSKLMDEFHKENKEEFDKYNNVSCCIQWLNQSWESYEARQKVKEGTLVHNYDIEKNGFPRTSRGNLCYLFIPIKGEFPKNATGNIDLYNPRKKKNETFTNLEYNKEDNTYACINPKGKKVFLAPYDEVEGAYSDLFAINKEIYSGWWNKIMIIK